MYHYSLYIKWGSIILVVSPPIYPFSNVSLVHLHLHNHPSLFDRIRTTFQHDSFVISRCTSAGYLDPLRCQRSVTMVHSTLPLYMEQPVRSCARARAYGKIESSRSKSMRTIAAQNPLGMTSLPAITRVRPMYGENGIIKCHTSLLVHPQVSGLQCPLGQLAMRR